MASTTDEFDPHRRRPWRADPDRYIRRVKGNKVQARPYNLFTRERENLGTFHTREQAQRAIREFWAGTRKGRPKFVRVSRAPRGDRFFVMVPHAGAGKGRGWLRLPGMHETPEAAARERDEFLTATYGRLVAAAMLSRADTSRRAGRY